MTASERRAYLQLHGCVILWGFTAILGRLISLPALAVVFWRMVLVTAMLLVIPCTLPGLRGISSRMMLVYAGIGSVVAMHWLAFYGAIKVSNASVAVACLGLGAVFAAIVEPIMFTRRVQRAELFLGCLTVPGVSLIVGGVPHDMHLGIVFGICAAFLCALFAILNKRYAGAHSPFAVTAIEMAAGSLLLGIPAVLVGLPLPDPRNMALLIALAAGCTLLPFVTWLHALRYVSAFSTQLLLNLEPLYAILLAAVIFREDHELTPQFYAGAALIIVTVVLQPWLRRLPAERVLAPVVEN